jgi:hypothetical protein
MQKRVEEHKHVCSTVIDRSGRKLGTADVCDAIQQVPVLEAVVKSNAAAVKDRCKRRRLMRTKL